MAGTPYWFVKNRIYRIKNTKWRGKTITPRLSHRPRRNQYGFRDGRTSDVYRYDRRQHVSDKNNNFFTQRLLNWYESQHARRLKCAATSKISISITLIFKNAFAITLTNGVAAHRYFWKYIQKNTHNLTDSNESSFWKTKWFSSVKNWKVFEN